jgi:hypothetical protein
MSPPTDERLSRRAALRAGATALTAGVAALTGCSGLPPLGSRVRYGTVSVPDARAPTYRDWLPAPEAAPTDADRDDYNVLAYDPPPDDAPAWTRGSIARNLVVASSDYVGVHIDDVDIAVGISSIFETGNAAVLAGDIDPATVDEGIAATSYEADGADGEYDLYTRPDIDRVLGVSTDGLVFGNGANAHDIVTSIADARRGDSQRYHDISTDFADLSAGAGSRRWTWLMPGSIFGSSDDTVWVDTVGRAFAFSHDDDGVYYVQTWLFPEGYGPTEGGIKAALERRSRPPEADAVEVTIDGRAATIEMARSLEAYREESSNTLVAPHVAWHPVHDADADTLRFEHEAGDTVETDYLTVAVGERDPITDFDVGDTIGPGEALTVSTADAESGTTVRLVYEAPDGNATATLAHRELP